MASIEAGISQSPTAVEALVASFEGQADRAPSTVPVARPSEGLLFEAQQQAFDAQQQALIRSSSAVQLPARGFPEFWRRAEVRCSFLRRS